MALAGARGAVPPVAPAIDGIGPEARNNLHLLHALRVALIHRVFMLTTHIPDFSTQHGISPEQLMARLRSEEHTSELQSLMRISYAVFCLKKKTQKYRQHTHQHTCKTSYLV